MSLTESDLRRLIRSIILEDKNYPKDIDRYPKDADEAVALMIKSFNVLLYFSRTLVFDEFRKIMSSQIKSVEGAEFCEALRVIPFTTRRLRQKGEKN